MRIILLLLLLTNIARGQSFTFNDLPWLSGSSSTGPFTPRSIPGLTLWWVHTNEAVNATVQDWPDLIQGTHAVNVVLGNSPTNAAIGMRFQQQWLKVTNWTNFKTNDAFFIIYRAENTASQRTLISGSDTASAKTKMSGINGVQHWISASGDISGAGLSVNASQLLVYSGATGTPSYTNGVLVSAAGTPFLTGAKPYAVTNMGIDLNFDGSGGLYIMEVGWYSNQSLTATDNYNISNYWKTFYP